MIPSEKSGEKRAPIDESSDKRKFQEKAPKITEREKQEEQQEHMRNHAKPSIQTMKDSLREKLALVTGVDRVW
jgi:hypothetical protein